MQIKTFTKRMNRRVHIDFFEYDGGTRVESNKPMGMFQIEFPSRDEADQVFQSLIADGPLNVYQLLAKLKGMAKSGLVSQSMYRRATTEGLAAIDRLRERRNG